MPANRYPQDNQLMNTKTNAIKAAKRNAQRETLQELRDLFEPWAALSKDFAKGGYNRLFSPLTHLLALLGPALERRAVPAGQSKISGLVGRGKKQDRLDQYGGLLQSA